YRSLYARAGFTLVELIVVIAILGILAGVGTVAYSGYITHTKSGLDENLYYEIKYAGAVGAAGGSTAVGTIYVTTDGASRSGSAELDTWMANAFGDDWENTVYYNLESSVASYGTIYLPAPDIENLTASQKAAVAAWVASNYAGNEEELLTAVGALTTSASSFLSDALENNTNYDNIADLVDARLPDLANFLSDLGYEDISELTETELSNAVVLYAASQASENLAVLQEAINDGNIETIAGLLEPDVTTNKDENGNTVSDWNGLLTTYAMYYSLVTAYASSEYATEDFVVTTPEDIYDVAKLYDAMMNDGYTNQTEGKGFLAYLGYPYTEEGYYDESDETGLSSSAIVTDLQAYYGALSILYDNKDYVDLSDANAFSNSEIISILQAYMR
ncbi:MAG: prepilin-type N-terminal cleavage/methylation domain-containing protein, partial [Firmicutes bacterium]|nr:prepilin-type N-terminal cleavage/methylation domain-containing protein [Bacillota bacterium]